MLTSDAKKIYPAHGSPFRPCELRKNKKYIAGLDFDTGVSTEEVSAGADATGDGAVDNKDLVRLKKYLAAYDYDTGTSGVILGPNT